MIKFYQHHLFNCSLPSVATALCLVVTLLASPLHAQTTVENATQGEITADSMDMDFANRIAVFTGNVVVVDRGMTLSADRMRVKLGVKNELRTVEATGNVVILQPKLNRKATSQKAVYDAIAGEVVLTENPVLQVGENRMTNAKKITYFRDNQRVIVDADRSGGAVRPKIRFTPGTAK